MRKKRIVVKIGSSSLTNDQGEIDQEKFNDHIEAVAALRQANHEVLFSFFWGGCSRICKVGLLIQTCHFKRKTSGGSRWSRFAD